MRRRYLSFLLVAAILAITSASSVYSRDDDDPPPPPRPNKGNLDEKARRFMQLDQNKDGKVTREEVKGEEQLRIFFRADLNDDGEVTLEEIRSFLRQIPPPRKEGDGDSRGPGKGKGGFGRGGFEGKDDFGKGGFEGKGGFGKGGFEGKGGFGKGGRGGFGQGGPRFQPGQVLPPFLMERLELNDEQKKELEDLQKDIRRKLDKILTDEQRDTLKEMAERPPFGGPGGPGGFGGPGGPGGRGGPEKDRRRPPQEKEKD